MFRNTYQSGFLSILYSVGAKPLAIWGRTVRNGHIKRITDDEVRSLVLEISGTNVATTYIFCPPDQKGTLGIKLPFLVMIIKNMRKYFTFEITGVDMESLVATGSQVNLACGEIDQAIGSPVLCKADLIFTGLGVDVENVTQAVRSILDDKDMRRRFRVSNYQSTTRVRPFACTMPIGLNSGWNQIQFNLADFTRRAYGTNYIETSRVQIHANCRVRRIYFSDRLYSEDELPAEFKLYMPVEKNKPNKQTNK